MTKFCNARSKNALLLLAILGVMVVGFLDYITGFEISFFLFYAGPILFSVWYLDRDSTVLIVLFSALAWWWADWKTGHEYFASWVQIWETTARLIFFSFAAYAGHAIKSRHQSMVAWGQNIERLRELEREIIAAGQREQQHLNHEINDGLCQYLAGLTDFTGSLRDHLTERHSPEACQAAELHDLLSNAIAQARSIARAHRQEPELVGEEVGAGFGH